MRNRCLLIALAACAAIAAAPASAQWNWFWKAGYHDYAPEGVPDFDQKQDAWTGPTAGQWTHCGPVAALDSLWWFDSRYEINLIPPPEMIDNFPLLETVVFLDDHDPGMVPAYVNELAQDMDTNGIRTGDQHLGTIVTDMKEGLLTYLARKHMVRWDNHGCWFEVSHQPAPSWDFVCEEVRLCHDVVLLLGFYQPDPMQPDRLRRIGGHYVTVAGVEPDRNYIAIADPYLDMLCWQHPGGHGPELHNDAQFVAHDVYAITYTPFDWFWPPLAWGLEDYPCEAVPPGGGDPPVINFLGQNPGSWEMESAPYYDPEMPVYALVDDAIKVWPNGKYGGRVLEHAGWHLWSMFEKTPWIWPDDFWVVDETTGTMMTAADAAAAGWLQGFIYGYGDLGYITYPPGAPGDPYIYPGYGYWVLTFRPQLRIVARYDLACGRCCWWRQGPIIVIDHNPFGGPE